MQLLSHPSSPHLFPHPLRRSSEGTHASVALFTPPTTIQEYTERKAPLLLTDLRDTRPTATRNKRGTSLFFNPFFFHHFASPWTVHHPSTFARRPTTAARTINKIKKIIPPPNAKRKRRQFFSSSESIQPITGSTILESDNNMLEASSLRRKHSSSPTDIKSGATNPFSTSNSSRASPSSLAVKSNDNSTVVEGDVDMQEASPSEMQEDQQSPQPGTPLDGLSAEDLSGVLDGALDDVDDEDLDGDTEDTEVAHEMEGASEGQNVDEEEDGENEDDVTQEDESKHDESGETNGPENEAVEEVASDNVDEEMGTPHSEDQGDGDGDVAINEQESDVEDEVTLATHTEDEDSEHPEEEGSHAEEEDDDDEDGEADEAEDDDDDEQPSPTPEVKKDVSSYPQKPTLNRPQLIEEELKDSGDELSDLSEFDDSDDSDEEEEEEEEEAEGTNKAKAGTNSLASNSSTTTSRPAPGTRKRSLREMSRDLKEQEEKMKRASKDNEGTDNQHSDRETESEVAEEEDVEEEKAEGDDEVEEEEREEEEDLEKKQLHMDALEALTTIEIEFATLRDNMYEERMLELDREVEMINDGTHPELSTLMKEIEDKREQRLKVAKAWRTHMGEIAQCEFEIKEYQAHCTFQSKKREIRNDITQELGRTKRKVILELTLASDSRRKNAIADKLSLVRARRHRRAEVNELRTLKEQYGFPASTKLRMVSTTELDEDFMAMGLPRTAIQLNAVEHEPQYLGRSMGTSSSPRLSTATATQKWSAPSDYSPYPRSEVEIYAEGNRCNVDGIWYKPNDAVAVLDASIGQYNAKYLHLSNEEILLQKTDGSKTRLHLNLFRARKLYMQPRP